MSYDHLPKTSPQFAAAVKGLNAPQKQAVEALEGPVMVVAGPGTGKTHVLTLRIAHILQKTDTPPDGILALTFTEAGASNMRRRLAKLIGAAAYRVRIHTFHSYCHDVIRRYPDDFQRIIGSEALTEVEKIEIIESILLKKNWNILKPFTDPLYYLDPIRSTISELKRENCLPKTFAAFVQKEQQAFDALPDLRHEKGKYAGEIKGVHQTTQKRIERSTELADIYTLYEAELRTRKRFDFEDMIVEVVQALETNNDMRLRLQEESLYILADEHQDANTAQNRLLELLGGESPNLFVVGDDKQAIFRFQGASLENFHYFKKLYPSAQLITLTDSYRSGQKILDTAHSLISTSGSSHAELTAASNVGVHTIEARALASLDDERAFVAQEIQKLVTEGVAPHEVAVIYRTNKEGYEYAQALSALDLVSAIESGQNALEDPLVRRLLILVRAVALPHDDACMLSALHASFVTLPPVDVYRIAQYAAQHEVTLAEVLGNKDTLVSAGIKKPKVFLEWWEKIERWRAPEVSVPTQVSRIIEESGFVAFVLKSDRAVEVLDKTSALVQDIESLSASDIDYSLQKLVAHLAILDARKVAISKGGEKQVREGAVRLMTAHRAKGLEFEHVFVVNVADGVWGGRTERTLFALPEGAARGSDEDERRLLYVAITRGKRSVTISYPKTVEGKEKMRSRLLEDISPELLHEQTIEMPKRLSIKSTRTRISKPTLEFVRARFVDQGLSVTALNNYLQCPWEYFYQNLVRIPKAQNSSLLFGTACHSALRHFFNARNRGDKLSGKHLVDFFEDALSRLPLLRQERAEMRERGVEFFSGWHNEWSESWPKESLNEYKVETLLPLSIEGLREVRLRGDLDKIEFLPAGITVTDYKTGRQRSRNELLGATKNATGDYVRQLIFYKLLLGLEGKYTMKYGVIDFLQPEKEVYKKEIFEILPEQVDELKREIERVAGEIWNLSFWNSRCGDKKCEFCQLREMMS